MRHWEGGSVFYWPLWWYGCYHSLYTGITSLGRHHWEQEMWTLWGLALNWVSRGGLGQWPAASWQLVNSRFLIFQVLLMFIGPGPGHSFLHIDQWCLMFFNFQNSHNNLIPCFSLPKALLWNTSKCGRFILTLMFSYAKVLMVNGITSEAFVNGQQVKSERKIEFHFKINIYSRESNLNFRFT